MEPAKLFCPWNSPGKNIGVDGHSLLQRIFLAIVHGVTKSRRQLSTYMCVCVCVCVCVSVSHLIQSLSPVWLFVTSWTTTHQASLSITNSQSLLKLMSIESVRPSNHLILCRPLLLPPLIFPSNRVFSSESVLRIRWPKYWSFSFSISPFNEYSGLVSFRMDWLDLLAVQGTLKSLLQLHSSKASILWYSAFFIVQLVALKFLIQIFTIWPTADLEPH